MGRLNQKRNSVFNSELASNWPAFVDCEKRLKTEAHFLLPLLNHLKHGTIFDAAMGMGCESIFLLRNGFNVVSNEIDSDLVSHALNLAKEYSVHLNLKSYDWRLLQ